MSGKILLVAAMMLFCVNGTFAQVAGALFNVRDFGAVGDGKSDDTAAIQKAFDAASRQHTGGRWRGIRYFSSGAVYFPNGHYRISDTIDTGKVNEIRGDGDACLEMSDDKKDIFFFISSWQTHISGMVFMGGRHQLNLGNANMDRGMIVIERCRFLRAYGIAVFTRPNSNSTYLQVLNSLFTSCDQALVSNCDKNVMRDCWVSTDPQMINKAAIVNVHGVMQIEGMLGVPLNGQPGQRWIDNHGLGLHCKNCRFGAEGGGFTPIYNFAKYSDSDCGATAGAVISVTDSEVNAQGSDQRQQCAVYCIELPNVIDIRNTALLGVAPVKIASDLKTEGYFDAAQKGSLRFSVDAQGIDTALPEILKNPAPKGKKVYPGQISSSETDAVMSAALKKLENRHATAVKDGVAAQRENWSVNSFMDATKDKNSEYLALGHKNGFTVLMKRTTEDRSWPHADILFPEVDIDKYPFLKCVFDNPGNSEFSITIKAADTVRGITATVTPRTDADKKSHLIDLRKFGFSGKSSIALKIYYIGHIYHQPPGVGVKYVWKYCKPGAYLLFETLAFVPGK